METIRKRNRTQTRTRNRTCPGAYFGRLARKSEGRGRKSQEEGTQHSHPVQQWQLTAADSVPRLAKSKYQINDGRHGQHMRLYCNTLDAVLGSLSQDWLQDAIFV